MDPVSHVVFAWCLNLGRSGRPTRPTSPTSLQSGVALASALGALAPDIDVLLIPAGWDRYLVAHEMATHSVAGAMVCGVAAAGVAALVRWKRDDLHKSRRAAPGSQGATTENIGHIRGRSNAARRDAAPGNHVSHHVSGGPVRRQPAMRLLVAPAVIGAVSHVVADLLSGAAIRLAWPLWDGRVSNLGVVVMAEPLLVMGALLGGIAMMRWRARQRSIAVVLLAALAALTLVKSLTREQAVRAYHAHPAAAEATAGYLVEPVRNSMIDWRLFDRTPTSVRAWSLDAGGRAAVLAQVPVSSGEAQWIAASQQWDTVRNFLRAHDFVFAVATTTRVEWSDLRYCEIAARTVTSCVVWAGGEFSRPPALRQLIVRVGDLVQTR
jgi:membrane-bound metal-dependent hydrolase YbcI (DUF457 family)